MRKGSKAFVVAVLAISLGGCQSLFGDANFAANSARPEAAASVDLSVYFAERLEAGRLHLRANRPTQAITAFRQASYDPAYAGDAYNGMGVAYAQMGRADLAKRYFGMALAASPGDERFARNLARLEGLGAAPEVQLAAREETPAEPARAEATAAPAPAVQAAPPAPMVRVSDKEVQIHSGASAAVASRSVAGQPEVRVVRASDKPRYPVRIALSDPSSAQASYPVRIELPKAK